METTARIWDVLLYERTSRIIFCVALGLLKMLQPNLEATYNTKNEDSDEGSDSSNMQNIFQYLQSTGKMQFDVEELFKVSLSSKCNVTSKEIEKLRKLCRTELQQEMDAIKIRRKKYEENLIHQSSVDKKDIMEEASKTCKNKQKEGEDV